MDKICAKWYNNFISQDAYQYLVRSKWESGEEDYGYHWD